MSEVIREEREIDPKRAAHVQEVLDDVLEDKKFWDYAYKRIEADRKFARGIQWPGEDRTTPIEDRKYVANITLSDIKATVASLYAKNPRFQWRRQKRLLNVLWDGTAQHYNQAVEMVAAGADVDGFFQSVIDDARSGQNDSQGMKKVGETLSILYEYQLRNQNNPTKPMMKRMVQTAVTVGVGVVKQTFHREMDLHPDVMNQMSDVSQQMAQIKALVDDLEDDEIDEHSPELSRLEMMMGELEKQPKVVLSEGLLVDYPDPLNIIPDREMTYFPALIGCRRCSEQYEMSPQRIQEIYGVDIGGSYNAYRSARKGEMTSGGSSRAVKVGEHSDGDVALVFEVWDKENNLVYTVCDGYNDFLEEPHAPEIYTERFWPWFFFAPNATDDADDPWPPSNTSLGEPMQREVNRSQDSLREHRWANRPRWLTGNALGPDDKKTLETLPEHGVGSLSGLEPGVKISDIFQEFPKTGIDPNLYNTAGVLADRQRTIGSSDAALGFASDKATATGESIAQSSRQTISGSETDELDDLFTEMAKAGSQILLLEMPAEKVITIVGPGAAWVEKSKEDVANELYLEVIAGSSGKPNRTHEIQVRERMLPFVLQIPGLKAEAIARDLITVMDDTIVYEDFVDIGAPSIVTQNGQQQAAANQGGANNAPQPPGPGPTGPAKPGQEGF